MGGKPVIFSVKSLSLFGKRHRISLKAIFFFQIAILILGLYLFINIIHRPYVSNPINTHKNFFELFGMLTQVFFANLSYLSVIYLIIVSFTIILFEFYILRSLPLRKPRRDRFLEFIKYQSIPLVTSIVILASVSSSLVIESKRANKKISEVEKQFIDFKGDKIDTIYFDPDLIASKIGENGNIPRLLDEFRLGITLLTTTLKDDSKTYFTQVLLRNTIIKNTQNETEFSNSIRKFETVIFPDGSLFVKTKDPKKLEKISRPISVILISKTRKELFKNNPEEISLSVLTQDEFIKLRKRMEEKINQLLQNQINILNNKIADVQLKIQKYNNEINNLNQAYQNALSANFQFYNNCMNSIIGYYNPSYCSSKKSELDHQAEGYLDIKNKYIVLRDTADKNLSIYTADRNYYEAILTYRLENPEDPYIELGIFTPPDNIQVAIVENQNDKYTQFLATVIHEFLHYGTYSEKENFPQFFEESITEYLTEDIINKQYGEQTFNTGYQKALELLRIIFEKTGKEKIIDAYLTKDENTLRKIIDKDFGNGTYDKISDDLWLLINTPYKSKQIDKIFESVIANLNGN